ncbi:DUF6212 domain-containing protein [Methylocystis sp. ATCC 49242]|uniref:DUF6212 domain-containing protein n=1 Tax=Methylocystis sp. ATCC 49242 TaxID=622637 RepID=UPI0001F87E1B|nr:DUF6212 domain-containing protein [Methylocystis sp. ATCC 49242]
MLEQKRLFCVATEKQAPDWLVSLLKNNGIERIDLDQATNTGYDVSKHGPLLGVIVEKPGAIKPGVALFPKGLEEDSTFVFDSTEATTRVCFWLAKRATAFARLSLAENSRNLIALGEVRSRLREVQTSFSHLEEYLTSVPFARDWLAFALPDAEDYWTFSEGSTGLNSYVTLTQALPQVVPFPSGVSLKLQHVRRGGNEKQQISLSVIGRWSRKSIGQWVVSLDAISGPWTRFEMPPSIKALDEPMEISLTIPYSVTPIVSVGLGKATPIKDYALAINGKREGDRPLSVRVYSGLPGNMRQPTVGALMPVESIEIGDISRVDLRVPAPLAKTYISGSREEHRTLGQEHLAQCQLVETAELADFDVVKLMPQYNGILVHPTGKEPTIAVVPHVPFGGGEKLSILVSHVGTQSEAAIECAAAVLKSAHNRNGGSLGDIVGHLGSEYWESLDWMAVTPGDAIQIHCNLPKGIETGDIILFSRSPSGNCQFAWSIFGGMYISRTADKYAMRTEGQAA